ncbi:hypothetical protein [Sphingobium sp. HWE2-09]|uniref:hypothetical protein n=1 Tax=Sphingobium sp. HWE2-09 TaxID=3108390 RepID=UPI00403E952E
MAQAHGYGDLNFRDLAADVGIKAASIYYNFPARPTLPQLWQSVTGRTPLRIWIRCWQKPLIRRRYCIGIQIASAGPRNPIIAFVWAASRQLNMRC